jgi:hypothetical protein
MTPTAVGQTVQVSSGLCAIQDASTQNAASPGTYLCSIDTNSEQVALDTNATGSVRYDLVYAEVDETAQIVTQKELTSNVATISTFANHGFLVNQTVVISGVDNTFDGSYVIDSVPSQSSFTYTRTASNVGVTTVGPRARVNDVEVNVSSYSVTSNIVTLVTTTQSTQFAAKDTIVVTGVSAALDGTYEVRSSSGTTNVTYYRQTADTSGSGSISSAAQARVPFAIKRVTGTSSAAGPAYPSGKTILPICIASVSTSNVVAIWSDLRQYVAGAGGVTLWNSSTGATAPAGKPGRLRFDTATNKLDFYDSTAAAWKIIYTNAAGFDSTHNHNTVYKQGVQSAASTLAAPVSVSSNTSVTVANTSNNTYTALSTDFFQNYTVLDSCYVMVQASFWLDVDSSFTTTSYARVGLQATGATTITVNNQALTDGTASNFGDIAMAQYSDTGGYTRQFTLNRIMKLSAGTTKIQLVGTRSGTTGVATVQYPTLRVIPLYKV